MSRALAVAAAATIITAHPSAAAAQAGGPLTVETRMLAEQRARATDGSTRIQMVPAAQVVPGTPVRIVIDYRNTGAQPIAGLVIANPVPANTLYRGVAAGVPQPEVTIDGARFAPLAALTVRGAGGEIRAAVAADVTAVRWRIDQPLPAGAKGQFAFEAVLK